MTQVSPSSLASFAQSFSIEVTPGGAARIADFRDHLPERTRVYVTSLSGSDFGETLDTCRKLHDQGMAPIPHITARGLPSVEVLDQRLGELASRAGVTGALAIAGGDHDAAGPFADTISMLETGLFQKHGIRSIGFAGHPEGLPGIERAQMKEHAHRKIDFARAAGIDMYIVTQFVFVAQPLFDFIGRIRAAGNDLPVIVGLPGLATIQSLIRHAQACGVGPSMQFLLNRAKDLRKLMTVQAPDRLLLDIANYRLENPDCGITGIHLFPLGGFDRTARWANAVAAGDIELSRDGFTVRDPA